MNILTEKQWAAVDRLYEAAEVWAQRHADYDAFVSDHNPTLYECEVEESESDDKTIEL